jgi:hypothetical protein
VVAEIMPLLLLMRWCLSLLLLRWLGGVSFNGWFGLLRLDQVKHVYGCWWCACFGGIPGIAFDMIYVLLLLIVVALIRFG